MNNYDKITCPVCKGTNCISYAAGLNQCLNCDLHWSQTQMCANCMEDFDYTEMIYKNGHFECKECDAIPF